MPEFELTSHAYDMLDERKILEEWLLKTIRDPDDHQMGEDNNMHYMKSIPERGEQILHVVVNPHVLPNRVITVFFDRRLRKKK
ncbi:MAG TPA: DUF4258 domain-containing protein [Anaerolineales bacterium]|nr:DUF4258 domain-containing protein [Anaerolineales bacterium]